MPLSRNITVSQFQDWSVNTGTGKLFFKCSSEWHVALQCISSVKRLLNITRTPKESTTFCDDIILHRNRTGFSGICGVPSWRSFSRSNSSLGIKRQSLKTQKSLSLETTAYALGRRMFLAMTKSASPAQHCTISQLHKKRLVAFILGH